MSQVCYKVNKVGYAYNCTLGIALLVVIGGFLNVFTIAFPVSLQLLFYGGVILTLIPVFRCFLASGKSDKGVGMVVNREPRGGESTKPLTGFMGTERLVFITVILVPFVFLIYYLMPAHSFNVHDDFQVYFVRPFRMLQTGTVGGDPFDILGLESLGSLSFVQAFTFLWLDAEYLNAFDAVLCFLLCIGLIIEIGRELKVRTIFILAAVVLFFLINSQYANISSLYSGSLMLLGIAYSYLILFRNDTLSKEPIKNSIIASLPLAFLFISLLSFKMTYFFITVLFFITSFLLSVIFRSEKKRVLQLHIFSALFVALFITPWVLIHLQKYLTLMQNFFEGISLTGGLPSGQFDKQIKSLVTGENSTVISELLSDRELFYGNTFRDYFLAIVMSLVTGLMAAIYVWRHKSKVLVPLITLLLIGALNYYLLSRLFPARLVIRYSCPVLFAITPLSVLLVGHIMHNEVYFWRDFFTSKAIVIMCSVLLVFQLIVGAMFGTTFDKRMKRVVNSRTLLSFPGAITDDYISYNLLILSETGKQKMLSHQHEIEPGLKILAWLSAPFWLDFSRNRLYVINHAGLHNDWLNLPLSEGTTVMLNYFNQLGINNFIWEYRGKGMKYGAASSRLADTLQPLASNSRILFDDGGTVVFNTLQQ